MGKKRLQDRIGEGSLLAEEVKTDREIGKLRESVKTSEKKQKLLSEELDRAEERLQVTLDLAGHYKPAKIKVDKSNPKGQACAIWLASDWHVGERVDPATINWMNEYNPDIAVARAKRFFQNGLKLVRNNRAHIDIKTLVLWIGGDIVTGYIHEELVEDNYLSPTQEVLLAKDIFTGGINLLLEDGEFEQIVVVTSYGNHGRTGPRRHHATGYKNSYEWAMYKDLERCYRETAGISFHVENGYLNYAEVFDFTLRFHHGDNIRYQGGVGGVGIPLAKFIARTNQQRRADCDFIGHFHQLDPYAKWRRYAINGSLIGFNAYALSIAASPEPPVQAFQLLDAKRGVTISAPILVAD